MAAKKKKKVKKRVRRFAVGGGTTTGTTITKDNSTNGGLGQGGQGTGSPAGGAAAAQSTSAAPAAGPPSASPTPASGAPGAPGGISGLPGGSAETAFKQTEASIKRGSGIGGAPSIEKGPISSTNPPANYKAPEVQSAVSQVNALRDVMQAQTQQLQSPFTKNIDKTVRHLAGETGIMGIGAGEVANVMVNREISNATPGTAKYNNDLDDKGQWASTGNQPYRAANPGSAVAGRVANEAIKGLMDGPQVPNATDFRTSSKTTKRGVDVGGNRFGNFEGVSAEQMADIRGIRGLSGTPKAPSPPSTVPSTENQIAAGKVSLDDGLKLDDYAKKGLSAFSSPKSMPPDYDAPTASTPTGPVLDKNGFMSPSAKKATQYGSDTLYSPNKLGDLYKDIGVYGIDDLDRKIAAEQALLGQTIGASQYGGEVTANLNNKISVPKGAGRTVDPTTANVVTHWTGGPAPLARIAGNGYSTVIDREGNINYNRAFDANGNMLNTNHTMGMNIGNYGIATQGADDLTEAQLDAARTLGENWFNKNASVTAHGYEAGTRIKSGDRPRSEVYKGINPKTGKKEYSTRPDREGVALGNAFAGREDMINEKTWTPGAMAGGVKSVSPEMSLAGREEELKNTTGLGALSVPSGMPPQDPRNPIGGMSFTPGLPEIPRSAAGTYTKPYDLKRQAAATYTDPYNPEVQGPVRYGGPLEKIPDPISTGYASLMTPAFPSDPRLSSPQGSYPARAPDSVFASDPRLSVPQGSYPAAPPPSAFASDPRLSIPQGSFPAAPPPSAFAQDPRLSIPQGSFPAAPPPSAFAQDPRLGVPQGAYPAGAETTVVTDPRAAMTPGGYPAAPEEPSPLFEGAIPGASIKMAQTIMGAPAAGVQALVGVSQPISDALKNGWTGATEPDPKVQKAIDTYSTAHSGFGKVMGWDKEWNKQVGAAVGDAIRPGLTSAIDSLQRSLADAGASIRTNINAAFAQDAERGAETVQKAEGAKMQDRLPGDSPVRAGKEGEYTISEPTEGGITLGDPSRNQTSAFQTGSEQFEKLSEMYNRYSGAEKAREEAEKRARGDYGPDVTGDEARELAEKAGFGPNIRYNDEFLSDPERLGVTEGDVNPEDLDAVDMAKIVNRSLARRYDDMDPNYLTKDEKETLIATKAAKQAVKQAPGAGLLMKIGEWWTEAEPVENYLGRPSYEKQALRQMGREADIKYGRRSASMPNTSGTTTNSVTQGSNASLPGEEKGGKYRLWAEGIGIPSPGDPAYAEYVWWYNSGGGW